MLGSEKTRFCTFRYTVVLCALERSRFLCYVCKWLQMIEKSLEQFLKTENMSPV